MLDREYIDKNGFKSPIIIKDKAGLDLKVPDPSFTVDDVEVAVGKSFHGMLGKGSQSSFCFRKSTLFIVWIEGVIYSQTCPKLLFDEMRFLCKLLDLCEYKLMDLPVTVNTCMGSTS